MNLNSILKLIIDVYPFRKGRSRLRNFVLSSIHGTVLYRGRLARSYILDLDNLIDSHIFVDGLYENRSLRYLSDWINKNKCSIFIDVGANIGSYTIPIASLKHIRQVYAFEPDPRNYSQLTGNIFLNRLYTKVSLYKIALSSENGVSDFYLSWHHTKGEPGDKFNTSTSSLSRHHYRHASPETAVVKVPLQRADDLIEVKDENIAVKIDVEGHEYSVLQGMQKLLRDNNCLLILEIGDDNHQQNQEIINSFLVSLGYKQSIVDSKKVEKDNFIYSK